MSTEGNEPKWGDRVRKGQQFKRKSGNKRSSRNTYSKDAVEQAENMRNRGVTG